MLLHISIELIYFHGYSFNLPLLLNRFQCEKTVAKMSKNLFRLSIGNYSKHHDKI